MARLDFRLICGILIGMLLALVYTHQRIAIYSQKIEELTAQMMSQNNGHDRNVVWKDGEGKFHAEKPAVSRDFTSDEHRHEENVIVDTLYKKVKVLCWIMTYPSSANVRKVKAVNETWASRCNKVIYFNTNPNLGLNTVDLNFTEGRDHLWEKTKKVLGYLEENYGKEYDWFFKADDDTFAVMENLRFLVSGYDPDHPHYIGCTFKVGKTFYNSGGAGYVMSRKALQDFITKGLTHSNCHKGFNGPEDLHLGKCLNAIGVNVTDTRDASGKLRFLPLSASHHFTNHLPSWFERYIVHEYYHYTSCCSDLVVTFHYIQPDVMYVLEFFTYHLRIFGRGNQYTVDSVGTEQEVFERVKKMSTAENAPGK